MPKPTRADRVFFVPRVRIATLMSWAGLQAWINMPVDRGVEMPQERKTTYIALAHNYDQVHDWMRKHGIHPRSVRIAQKMEDVRGLGGEFYLIIFSGWMERGGEEKMRAGDYLMAKSAGMYFVDTHDPHVNSQGLISFWVRKREDSE